MAEINLNLFPKQNKALNTEADEVLYGGAAGGGKLVKLGDSVLTPFGFKPIEELRVGDRVNNPDGSVSRVVQLKPWVSLPRTTVWFHDGTHLDVTDDHLWQAWRSGKRKKRSGVDTFGSESCEVIETRELATWLVNAQDQEFRGIRPNWPCTPVCEEQIFNVQRRYKIGIDPYLLGQFLGDGHIASSTITSADVDFMREVLSPYKVTEESKPNSRAMNFRIKQAPELRAGFKRAGLTNRKSWDKFIPDEYKVGSIAMRYSILQGLLDSDGCVEDGRRVTYTTVSEKLAEDVAFVARSLGALVMRRTKTPSYTLHGEKKKGRLAYVLEINHRQPWKLFRLPRKLGQARDMTVTPLYRRVVRIEQSRELITGRCITVSHPNGLYLTNDFIVTHNSHLMRVAAIIWCYLVPGLQVYIFRRLSTDLYKNHMEGVSGFVNLLEPWVKTKFCKIVQPGTIRFTNGSRIFLNHCQYEHNVTQYQGTDIHVLMIDELTHWTEPMYTFLRGRLRAVGINPPPELEGTKFPRILCGTNPGGVGHNWVKATFVDMTAKGTRMVRTEKADGGMLRGFIPALVADNPALMEQDPGYMDRLEGLDNPALVRAMKLGDWDIVAGGMFDDVWNPEAIVLPKFKIPGAWPINRSFDWGESKPFSVGWWAETGDEEIEISPGITKTFYPGSLIRIAEWYGWNGKPNTGCKMPATDIAKGIRKREALMELHGRVEKGPADSAIFDENEGSSVALRMNMHGVRWSKADKRPGSRVQGWSRMREMFLNSAKVPMDGPGLFCFPECEHFIRTIPSLPRDKKKQEDVDTDAEDHVGDETRYRVWRKRAHLGVVKTVGSA